MGILEKLGRSRRAFIINGRVALYKGKLLVAQRLGNDIQYLTYSNGVHTEIVNGRGVIDQMIRDDPYMALVSNPEAARGLTTTVDNFTQAIVMESKAFAAFKETVNHGDEVQQTPQGKILWTNSFCGFMVDYYELFHYLMAKRLGGNNLPAIVKGHMVAGLYQPLVVSTPSVACPLEYPECQEFMRLFSGTEEVISQATTSYQQLNLSCVSSFDYGRIFGVVPTPIEMDRKVFTFCNYLALLVAMNNRVAVERMTANFQAMSNYVTNPPMNDYFREVVNLTQNVIRR